MRIFAKSLKLPLTLFLLLTGVSFASESASSVTHSSSSEESSQSEGEATESKLDFYGEVNVSSCNVSEIRQGQFIQQLPLFVGTGAGIQRIDNYVINFTQCQLDESGMPYADLSLTKYLNDDTLSILTTPQFRLISHGDNAVDSIRVPLASDTYTVINIGVPKWKPMSGLLYIRAYYPVGVEPLAAPYDNITLEINYK